MSKNIWKDLGRTPENQMIMKAKTDLWNQILDRVEQSGFKQKDLAELWHTKQPNVSKIINGRLTDTSIELLISYLTALGLEEVEFEYHYGT